MVELAGVLVLLGALFTLLVLLAAPLILAFFLVATILRLVFFVIFLPFRILGWTVGIGLGALGLALKGAFLAGIVALLILAGFVPLIPILLLGGLLYLLVRSARRREAPPVSA